MILGKIKGRPLHGFCIHGHLVFVVRSDEPVRVSAYDAKTGGISSLAPPGMSYHQAALEAVAALERGEFH